MVRTKTGLVIDHSVEVSRGFLSGMDERSSRNYKHNDELLEMSWNTIHETELSNSFECGIHYWKQNNRLI